MSTTSAAVTPTARARPNPGRLLADQVRYAVTDLWRARVVLVFTLLIPLVWLVVIGIVAGNETVDEASGVRVMQFVTPSAAAMGVLYGAFPTVAISLCDARERGVVKRVRGTPLPMGVYLAGRVVGAVVFALASVTGALLIGVLAYDVQVVWRTVPATAVTLVLAVACFAAMGVAVAVLAPSTTVAQAASIAAAVAMPFLSGTFTPGGRMPGWLAAIGSALPFRPLTEALQRQFNPFHTDPGWDRSALLILAAWGLMAAVVAVRSFRWEPTPGRVRPPKPGRDADEAARTPSPRVPGGPASLRTGRPTRPSSSAMVLDQVVAGGRSMRRDPGSVFFTVVMPVGLYALMVTIQGAATEVVGGIPFAVSFAAGMVVWGAGVAAFMNLPETVASARDRGVLQRLRGTPLRPWQYLAGRTVAVLVLAGAIEAVLLSTGAVFYGVRVTPAGAATGLAVTLLGTLALAACGFAVAAAAPSAPAVGAIGLVVLLPLSFFSDVFPVQGPAWMATVGSFFPLKHLQNGLVAAWDPAGPSVPWLHVAVLALWTVGAAGVAVRWFRWERASR